MFSVCSNEELGGSPQVFLVPFAAYPHLLPVLKRHPFIQPSVPVLKPYPPEGADWLHEVKFDGWRAQLHKDGDAVAVYSRNGRDMTRRFPFVRDSLIMLPAHTAIIDAEIVVCDTMGDRISPR
jgi:ATP-dependent DNA ligase